MATAEKLGHRGRPRRDRRASTRASSRWCATCCVERAAVERGEEVARSAVGDHAALAARSARPAAAPTRAASARRCAGPTRERTTRSTLRDLASHRRAARPPSWPAACAAAASTWPTPSPAPSTSSPRPTVPCEELIRHRLLEHRPDDAILGEEGDDHAGHQRGALGRRPDRRHRQLPLRPARLGGLHRRGGRRTRSSPASSSTVPTGVEYAAARGAGATRDGVPIAVRPAPPLAERLVLTGFGYRTERARPPGRVRSPGCCRRSVTSAAWAPAPWTCATSPTAAGTRYVEEGPARWDWAAGVAWSRPRRGPCSRRLPGRMSDHLAPVDGLMAAIRTGPSAR